MRKSSRAEWIRTHKEVLSVKIAHGKKLVNKFRDLSLPETIDSYEVVEVIVEGNGIYAFG